jgi:ABC-type Fe3+ transport system substrate-binding protein
MDVGCSFAGYLLPVIERDLLDRCDWVKVVGVDPKRVLFDGRFISTANVPQVWVYNTKIVSKAEMPKKLEDTLDPRWKDGKISVRAAPSGFNWLFPVWKQDKQKAIDYLNRLAKQDILPATRGSEGLNRVATGECAIGAAGVSIVIPMVRKGAPLALCPIPTAADPEGLFIPKGVRHPDAAKFLLAWLASPEGTKAFHGAGLGASYPPDASPQAKLLADNGIVFSSIESQEDVREYAGPFSESVMKIMGFKAE